MGISENSLLEESLKVLSAETGLPYLVSLQDTPFVKEKKGLLPYEFVHKHKILPIAEENHTLKVAISNPFQLALIEEIHFLTGKNIQEVLSSEVEINRSIEFCYRSESTETANYLKNLEEEDEPSIGVENNEDYDLLNQDTDSSTIKLLNMIIVEALHQGASDIHFDPTADGLGIRYRVDGILQEKHLVPKEMQNQMVTRIKVLAKLDIAEQRMPQDGRIKLRMGSREIDFRVSTVLVAFGERIVLRILDRGSLMIGLENLGMREETLKAFRSFAKQSQGIVLVTGPTGSGKTTTLYSALSEINSPEMNLMTIEDPVEFKLPGMAQISVNQKIDLTFAKGLRHILRQDPDVIMIGEIRDLETAEIAIQSSLTGHLVFSTLHTNDAPSAVTRLVDMGIEPYLLSSSILAVLAQRLVRKVCPHCKEAYTPSQEELEKIGTSGAGFTEFYRGEGCEKCFFSGYLGRYGIYELLPFTHKIKQQIIKSVDSNALMEVAAEEGLSTLRDEGIRLMKEGITTLEEVLRVTRATKEEIL